MFQKCQPKMMRRRFDADADNLDVCLINPELIFQFLISSNIRRNNDNQFDLCFSISSPMVEIFQEEKVKKL